MKIQIAMHGKETTLMEQKIEPFCLAGRFICEWRTENNSS
jgi:hypothetical protein